MSGAHRPSVSQKTEGDFDRLERGISELKERARCEPDPALAGLGKRLEAELKRLRLDVNLHYTKNDYVENVMNEYLALAGSSISISYFDNLFQSIGDPLIVVDPQLNMVMVNHALEHVGGYRNSDLIQAPITQVLLGMREAGVRFDPENRRSAHFRNGLFLRMVDGEKLPILLSVSPLYDGMQLEGFVCLLKDISQDIEREEALHRAKEAAEEAARIKAEFLANMSHEIRTPLNGILGMTDLMLSSELGEEQLDNLQTIQSSGKTLLNLLNDILDFSKLESGHVSIHPEPFSLGELMSTTLKLLGNRAEEKGLKLHWKFGKRLSENTTVVSDIHRVQQILSNLVGNAIKFTEAGDVAVEVHREAGNDSMIRFSVKDSGMGIPSSKQRLLFRPFSQVDASITREFGGTGLGLSICRNLCHLLGGSIWVNSRPQKGSCFRFTLKSGTPLGTARSRSRSPKAVAAEIPSLSGPVGDYRVLLVEDNVINQKVAMRTLTKLGLRPDLAANGLEAVEAARKVAYHLILMDMQMPKMDGLEATRRILDLRKESPPVIVALTANALDADRRKCLQAGMSDFLPKPILLPRLAGILQMWLPAKETESAPGAAA